MKLAYLTLLRRSPALVSRPVAARFFVLMALLSGCLAASASLPPRLEFQAPGGVPLRNGVHAWGYNEEDGITNVPAGLTDVKAVSAGIHNHTLVLKSDGTVVAWGNNYWGQCTVPAGLTGVVAIAAGESHSLALQADGSVFAWGRNDDGQGAVPENALTDIKAIGTGYYHNLAVKNDGTVLAWGYNNAGQTDVPADLTDVIAVAAGATFSVALKADGTVVAWGENYSFQTDVPPGLTDVVAIAAGAYHVLALKSDGSVVGWGSDDFGESIVPASVAATTVKSIAAGGMSSLAVLTDGTTVAWGQNYEHQADVPALVNHQTLAGDIGGNHAVIAGIPKLEFGGKGIGTSTTMTVTVKNTGSGNLNLTLPELSGEDTGDFTLGTGTMSTTLASGGSTTFTVTFAPGALGLRRTLLQMTSNDARHDSFLLLTGNGMATDASLSSLNVKYGALQPAFHADTLDYTATLSPWAGSITVIPVTAQPGATVQVRLDGGSYAPAVSGEKINVLPAPLGDHTVDVLVTAQDGITTRTYHVAVPAANDLAEGAGTGPVPDGTAPDQPGAPLDVTFQRWGLASTVANVAVDFTLSPGHDRMGDLAVTLIAPDGTQQPLFTRVGGSATLSGTYLFCDGTTALLSATAAVTSPVPGGMYSAEEAAAAKSLATTFGGKTADGTWTLRFQDFANGGTTAVTAAHLHLALNATLPQIVGPTVSNVGPTTATLGATVSREGYTDVLDRGVVVAATSVNATPAIGGPGVLDFSTYGTTGEFTVDVSGLVQNTGYTFRGYVRNSQGTVYTSPGVFTTVASPTLGIETSDGTTLRNGVYVFGWISASPSTGLSNVSAVTQGGYHTLALKSDRTVSAFTTSNAYGQATVPPGLGNVRNILASGFHSVALKYDGTVQSWGQGYYGQLDSLPGLTGVQAIATANSHTLTVGSDGTVSAFGDTTFPPNPMPEGMRGVHAVATGGQHSVALRSDGTLEDWGYVSSEANWTKVPQGLTGVTSASVTSHVVALRSDGTVVAWGSNFYGESNVPAGLTGVTAVAAGGSHSLALKADGTVVGWGSNNFGQISGPAAFTGVTAIAAATDNSTIIAAPNLAFGGVTMPASITKTLTLRNNGSESLTLADVRLSGVNAGDFTLNATGMAATLSAGFSTTFNLTFTPSALGARTAKVEILSNDPDHPVAQVILTGTGNAASVQVPVLTVRVDPPSPYSNGASQAYATIIHNGGEAVSTAPADRGFVYSLAAQNSDPQVNAPGTSKGSANLLGDSLTGDITFQLGETYAVRSFAHNSAGFGYSPVLIFTAGSAPEIGVIDATSGMVLSAVNFGNQVPGTTSAARTVTIRNNGQAPLAITSVTLIGTDAGEFVQDSSSLTSTLAADGSTSVSVAFNPAGLGPRTATLRILSNDQDQPSFDVALTGTGAPIPAPIMYSFQGSVPGETTATLSGQVMMNFGPPITERGVVYALTSVNDNPLVGGPGVTKVAHASVGSFEAFSVDVSGLSPHTAYSFRAYATNPGGSGYSSLGHFTTTGTLTVPALAQITVDEVGTTTFTAGATITNNGGDGVTERGMVLAKASVNSNPMIGGSGVTKVVSADSTATFNVNAANLDAETAYWVRFYATNSIGTGYSGLLHLTTQAPTYPEIRMQAPEIADFGEQHIGRASDPMTFFIWNDGGAPLTISSVTTTGGHAADFGVTTEVTPFTIESGWYGEVNVRLNPTELGARTATLRIASDDSDEPVTEITLSGTGLGPLRTPVVSSPSKSNITNTFATLGGTLVDPGDGEVTEFGVLVAKTSDNDDPVLDGPNVIKVLPNYYLSGYDYSVFNVETSGLDPDTGYTFRAFARNVNGVGYSPAASFTTKESGGVEIMVQDFARVDHPSGSSLRSGTVTMGGSDYSSLYIRNAGSGTLSVSSVSLVDGDMGEFYVYYAGSDSIEGGGEGALYINYNPTALGTHNATLRIVSNDADEATYDLTLTGTTVVGDAMIGLPTVANIQATGAKLGSKVFGDGGAEVIERGVLVSPTSVNEEPALDGEGVAKFAKPGATGTFTLNATGFAPSTSYTFRGFVTTTFGTAYTEVSSFTTLSPDGDGIVKLEQPAGVPFGGSILGWGSGTYGGLPTDGQSRFTAIATGPYHTLALRDGKVTVFGSAEDGAADPHPELTDIIGISAGYDFSAAVKSDGTVVTWGTGEPAAAQSLNLTNVKSIASSQYQSFHVAVKNDGTLVAWGADAMDLPPDLSNIKSVSIGRSHGLALTLDGHVIAFGEDEDGDTDVPDDLADVVAIAAGYHFSLAVLSDGTLRAWGEYNTDVVEDAAGVTDVVAVAAGRNFAIVLKADGSVVALGYDYGTATDIPVNARGVTAVACGPYSTFALQNAVAFGRVLSGGPTVTRTITLTNTGTGPLAISGAELVVEDGGGDEGGGGGDFFASGEGASGSQISAGFTITQSPAASVEPGESTTVVIRFNPVTVGDYYAMLRIATDDASHRMLNIPVSGTGVPPSHPPVAQDVTIAIHEDHSLRLENAIEFSDEDEDALTGIKITTLPTIGTLWDGLAQITEAGTVASTDVIYRPVPDAFGPDYDSFTFQVVDSGLEDANTDLTPRNFHISVNSATEPPQGTDKTITVASNGRYTFSAEDFGFSDPNDTPPNEFVSVRITHVPAHGQLYLNGRTVYGSMDGDEDESSVFHLKSVPGNRWIGHEQSTGWTGLAASADGSKLLGTNGDELYTSTDSGKHWTLRASAGDYTAVASSADGLKLIAATTNDEDTGALHTSADGGLTWTLRALNGNWSVVACSADGSTFIAADRGFWYYDSFVDDWVSDGGKIHVSTDGGATWTPVGENRVWSGIACSADGSRLIGAENFGFLHTSSNGGQLWTQRYGSGSFRAVTSSGDGLKLAACTSNGLLVTSSDGGETWLANRDWEEEMSLLGLAASADGSLLLARSTGRSSLYVSHNSGASWAFTDLSDRFLAIAVAGDGSRLFAASTFDTLFVSEAAPDELVYVPDKFSGGPPTSDSFRFAVQDDGSPAGNTDTTPNLITIEFGPPIPPPSIIHLAAKNLTSTGATVSATIVADPEVLLMYAGFVWAKTAENPDLSWSLPISYVDVDDPQADISSVLTGLETGVSYTLIAWVDSSTGYVESAPITFTPGMTDHPLAVGNLVFFDKNDNGHADAGEGVDNVTVQLYTEAQTIGEDEPTRTTTTTGGGFWLIDNLAPGSYRLFIPPTMFAGGAPLYRMQSVQGVMTLGDDLDGEKGQDSMQPATSGVQSEVFMLAAGTLPAGDGEPGLQGSSDDARDADIDLTRDFGFVDVRERPATFEQWKQEQGIGSGGSGTDQNHNGRDDLIEYALGDETDPGFKFEVEDNHDTGETDVLLRRRRGGHADLILTVLFCPDLSGEEGDWESSVIQPIITINDDGTETLTFPNIGRDPALTGSSNGFTRLIIKLDVNGDGVAEATAKSGILGWQHRSLDVKTQTYGLPFVRPAVFGGVVDGVTGSTLDLSTAAGTFNIVSHLVAGERYYVEVISGANEGHRIDVDAAATTATSIALLPGSEFSTLTSVPATLAGNTIALRPHWRVKDVFPPADYTPGTSAANSDQIQLWSAAQAKFVPLLLGNHPTQGRMWVAVGGSTSENNRVIGPADGLFVKPRQDVVAASDGQVRTWKFACPLRAGSNLIGNPFPVDQSFSDRLMTLANGFLGAVSANDADRVNAWSGDTTGAATPGYLPYTLSPTGVWVKVGEVPVVNHTNTPVFGMGTAAFINSKNGNPTWVLPAAVAP